MKSKTMILMVVAVGCGLAASYMTSRLLAERNTAQVEPEKVTILVAKQPIAMGTLLKEPEKLFAEKQFTAGEEPKNALRKFEELKGWRLNKPLGAEHHVTKEDLMDEKAAGFEHLLPQGKRAVAIKVTVDSLAGGFIQPNAKVDVVLVNRGGGETMSQVLLQNMLVLAVGERNNRDVETNTIIAPTVTLAASPEESLKLTLAQAMGELKLLLRKFAEEETVKVQPARARDVITGVAAASSASKDGESGGTKIWGPAIPDAPAVVGPAAEVKQPEPPKEPRRHVLLIYNGSEAPTKEIYEVNDDGSVTAAHIEKTPAVEAPARKKSQPDRKPAAAPAGPVETN